LHSFKIQALKYKGYLYRAGS